MSLSKFFIFLIIGCRKTLYANSEEEYLAIIQYHLAVILLVSDSCYLVIIYLVTNALRYYFAKEDIEKEKIDEWMNRLEEFDFKLVYKSPRNQIIWLANSVFRIPIKLFNEI